MGDALLWAESSSNLTFEFKDADETKQWKRIAPSLLRVCFVDVFAKDTRGKPGACVRDPASPSHCGRGIEPHALCENFQAAPGQTTRRWSRARRIERRAVANETSCTDCATVPQPPLLRR